MDIEESAGPSISFADELMKLRGPGFDAQAMFVPARSDEASFVPTDVTLATQEAVDRICDYWASVTKGQVDVVSSVAPGYLAKLIKGAFFSLESPGCLTG